jgi:lycopene cyclase domain-containing protein
MIYLSILLFFGLIPLLGLVLLAPRHLWRYRGTFFWITLFILWVSVPWESSSVGRIWFYSPHTVVGLHLLGIPIEEYNFFVLDALLVTALGLLLRRGRADGSA